MAARGRRGCFGHLALSWQCVSGGQQPVGLNASARENLRPLAGGFGGLAGFDCRVDRIGRAIGAERQDVVREGRQKGLVARREGIVRHGYCSNRHRAGGAVSAIGHTYKGMSRVYVKRQAAHVYGMPCGITGVSMATKKSERAKFWGAISVRWPEFLVLGLFIFLAAFASLGPLLCSALAASEYVPAFNVALSIGTSGIVAFVFFYVVNERLDRRRRELVRQGALRAYRDAKHNIVVAIIHASQKGGRKDLHADTDTIPLALTPAGFRALIGNGRNADEGFYAFENQMSERTPEFDEIIFNLRSMGRAFDRLVDAGVINDEDTYNRFVRLNGLVRRIEHTGPGYDESKGMCQFIWQIFAGWSPIDGYLPYDPIERVIEQS